MTIFLRVLAAICLTLAHQTLGSPAAVDFAAGVEPITVGFLNFHSVKFDIATVDNYEAVFLLKQTAQSLLDEDESGSIIPSIAKFWTISSNMKNYRFSLRENVRFHDGKTVTADEVRKSIEVIKSSSVNPANYCLKKINRIEVFDPLTIEFSLNSPWFGFLHCLSSGLVPVFSSAAYRNDKSFVGSGPYRLSIDKMSPYLHKYSEYVGPYKPREAEFKILLSSETTIQPDILINDLSHYPSFEGYEKSEIDSFVAFNFMINPQREEWRDRGQRLLLIKSLLETKKSISSPRLKDLKDIFPKGMLGYDLSGEGFRKLMSQIKDLDPAKLLKKKIVIGSLGPIMNFEKLAAVLAEKYGIFATNYVARSPNYLEKLYRNKHVDVFTVGWGSIFNHPDATFVPFYILGIKDLDDEMAAIMRSIGEASDRADQFELYRYLSFLAVSEGYVLPHSQVSAGTYTKRKILVPKYRYRYTLQLSEVERKNGKE